MIDASQTVFFPISYVTYFNQDPKLPYSIRLYRSQYFLVDIMQYDRIKPFTHGFGPYQLP